MTNGPYKQDRAQRYTKNTESRIFYYSWPALRVAVLPILWGAKQRENKRRKTCQEVQVTLGLEQSLLVTFDWKVENHP